MGSLSDLQQSERKGGNLKWRREQSPLKMKEGE